MTWDRFWDRFLDKDMSIKLHPQMLSRHENLQRSQDRSLFLYALLACKMGEFRLGYEVLNHPHGRPHFMGLNLKLHILVEQGHLEDALLLIRNYLSVRSRRYDDSKIIFLREVISRMVEEVEDKAGDSSSLLSELQEILRKLDHVGTIRDRTLEEAVLTPINATNRDENRGAIQ